MNPEGTFLAKGRAGWIANISLKIAFSILQMPYFKRYIGYSAVWNLNNKGRRKESSKYKEKKNPQEIIRNWSSTTGYQECLRRRRHPNPTPRQKQRYPGTHKDPRRKSRGATPPKTRRTGKLPSNAAASNWPRKPEGDNAEKRAAAKLSYKQWECRWDGIPVSYIELHSETT